MATSQSGRKSPKTPKTPKSSSTPVRPADQIPETTLPENTSLFRTIALRQDELVPLFQTKLGANNVTGFMSALGISGEGALRFAPSINGVSSLADSVVLLEDQTTKQQLEDHQQGRPASEEEESTLHERSTTPTEKRQEQTSTGRKTGGEKDAGSKEESSANVDTYFETDVLSLHNPPRSADTQRKELTGSRSVGFAGGYAENEAAAIVRYYVHRQPKLACLREDKDAFRYLAKAYIQDESTLNEFVLAGDEDQSTKVGDNKTKAATVSENITSRMLSGILKDHGHLLTRSIIRAMQSDGFEGWWLKEPTGQEELLLFNPRAHVYASDVQLQHPQKSLQAIQLIFAHPNGQGTPMTFRLNDTVETIRHVLASRYPALAQASEIGLQLGDQALDETEDQKTIDELNIKKNSLIYIKPGGGSDPKKQKGAQKKKK
eukprot:gb/GECG01011710.1/.p1 GENE.gb/GECG01011710.1/~~gb/GECG01011710.1/.p1  ORF type:complete len:433 (+),score=71.67 gb/GECG01011710.1/:1-1299(+)